MGLCRAYIDSPFGGLLLEASSKGLTKLGFQEKPSNLTQNDKELAPYIQQLEEYFQKERTVFDLPLDWSNTADFDKQVWTYLQSIPFGRTCSYSDVANAIENPKAVRAVGAANARNPIPIIVPCHRVIGKNGHLTGFASGLDMKADLLQHENPLSFGKQSQLFN